MPSSVKRFRLRLSIRTLVVVVTLLCCYAACWEPTKQQGVEDVTRRLDKGSYWGTYDVAWQNVSPVIPFVVRADIMDVHRCYYFWFFGYVADLPFERRIDLDKWFLID